MNFTSLILPLILCSAERIALNAQNALCSAEEEIPQYVRGYLEFPQVSKVKQFLSCHSHHRVTSDPW